MLAQEGMHARPSGVLKDIAVSVPSVSFHRPNQALCIEENNFHEIIFP